MAGTNTHERAEGRLHASPTGPRRLAGLDALRGLAAVLVVMLHAGTPYALFPMPGLIWPVGNRATSPVVDAVFWGIEGFIMPLFLVLAGFVAVSLHDSLGGRGFVKHRARRLLVPMLFGSVFILPLDLYVWVFGCAIDGRCTLRDIQRMKFPVAIEETLWGFSHLWFLEYLFLYCAALAAGHWLWQRGWPAMRRSHDLLSLPRNPGTRVRHWLALIAGTTAAAAAVVWWKPRVVYGFQHAFLPVPSKFLYSGVFFAAGVALQRLHQRTLIRPRLGIAGVAAALALFAALLPLAHAHLGSELTGRPRIVLAAGTGLFAALMSLGLVAAVLTWNPTLPVWLRRLNEASFWIYLAHHPVVGLAHIALAPTTLTPAVRFLLATAAAISLCLLTWHIAVRGTWVDIVLHGRPRSRPVPSAQPLSDAPARAA